MRRSSVVGSRIFPKDWELDGVVVSEKSCNITLNESYDAT